MAAAVGTTCAPARAAWARIGKTAATAACRRGLVMGRPGCGPLGRSAAARVRVVRMPFVAAARAARRNAPTIVSGRPNVLGRPAAVRARARAGTAACSGAAATRTLAGFRIGVRARNKGVARLAPRAAADRRARRRVLTIANGAARAPDRCAWSLRNARAATAARRPVRVIPTPVAQTGRRVQRKGNARRVTRKPVARAACKCAAWIVAGPRPVRCRFAWRSGPRRRAAAAAARVKRCAIRARETGCSR
jgi:hypothetical protein